MGVGAGLLEKSAPTLYLAYLRRSFMKRYSRRGSAPIKTIPSMPAYKIVSHHSSLLPLNDKACPMLFSPDRTLARSSVDNAVIEILEDILPSWI